MSIIKGTNQIVAGFGGTKRSIGEVYFSQSALATDNSGALPLFTGETIASANTIYPEFYNWVSAHTELQCTAAEYEASLTTYGECAKYVIGGGSLRLPLIKNYIKAANPSEGIKNIEAGLPNIMGDVLPNEESGATWTLKTGLCAGAFSAITNSPSAASVASVEQNKPAGIRFDASRSSAVYGKSSTVTPASTTLYPWVVAYTAAVPASTAQAAEFQQGLSGKADTNLGNTIPSQSFKEMSVGWGMPDYSSAITGNAVAGKFIQCPADAAVCVFGQDPYTENFYAYVSPDNGTTKYIVGRRTDDVNSNTQTTSFYFLVPKNWYFTTTVEQGFTYQIYPLSGGQNA